MGATIRDLSRPRYEHVRNERPEETIEFNFAKGGNPAFTVRPPQKTTQINVSPSKWETGYTRDHLHFQKSDEGKVTVSYSREETVIGTNQHHAYGLFKTETGREPVDFKNVIAASKAEGHGDPFVKAGILDTPVEVEK
jgi:hypothetical protein